MRHSCADNRLEEVGYLGFGTNAGIFVKKEDALAYAMKHVGVAPIRQRDQQEFAAFAAMLEEWFFSGNWVRRWRGLTGSPQNR